MSTKKLTTEEFIEKARKIHNNKYNYDKTVYTNATTKVTITCPEHGDFTIIARGHTNSRQGCGKCAGNVPYTTETFIEKAKQVHGDLYDYTKTIYTRAHDKVVVTCPVHGDFEQKAYVHLAGHSCPFCANETISKKAIERKSNGWSYTNWASQGEISSSFVDYSVYIIKCWNNNETFYKIGKTFTSLSRRFSNLPYNWVLVSQIIGSSDYINTLEHSLQASCKNYEYTPLEKFNGYKECFIYTQEVLDEFNSRTTIST